METIFNSQICTTREQSERLLALGLKKETADMVWLDFALTGDYDDWRLEPIYKDWEEWQKYGIPAWSLHRLIEMMPSVLGDYDLCVNSQMVGYFSCVGLGYSSDWFLREGDTFNCIIDCIEWLIKEGYFNKEYLV